MGLKTGYVQQTPLDLPDREKYQGVKQSHIQILYVITAH